MTVPANARWTTEEISLLCEFVRAEGVHPAQIAFLLGRKSESQVLFVKN